jgi:hypothetical protein
MNGQKRQCSRCKYYTDGGRCGHRLGVVTMMRFGSVQILKCVIAPTFLCNRFRKKKEAK